MTQEEKQLLLKDLCARLPYGVKVHHPDYLELQTLDTVFNFDAWQDGGIQCDVDDVGDRPCDMIYCKPYLRPMSSMTEEEQKEYHKTFRAEVYGRGFVYVESIRSFDWLNKNMFDYRGLIEKGLAIEVTEEFNPYNEDYDS